MKAKIVCILGFLILPALSFSQDISTLWTALDKPAFDPAKTAQVSKLLLQRDRIQLLLTDGTIQFTQPQQGLVFGAVFRGHGTLQVTPPNAMEAQQLHLHTGESKLGVAFTEAVLVFSDGTFDELAAKLQWTSGDAQFAELYAKRQKEREDYGEETVPRIFKSLLSSDRKRSAFFLADIKAEKGGWLQVRFDGLNPEEVKVSRWVDQGTYHRSDTWMQFAAGNRPLSEIWKDPLSRSDYAVRKYTIDAAVSDNTELRATAKLDLTYLADGERVLLFAFDSNLRVDSVKDQGGAALPYFQARDSKDRAQSFGEYVAVVLPAPVKAGTQQSLEFHYAGKRVIEKVGSGNFFCRSSGWYPSIHNDFATRSEFELNFRSPKKYTLVATGSKTSESTDGNLLITTWKSDIPLAVAGFAFGDFKVYTDKANNVEINIYANRQGDDQLQAIQRHFEGGGLPGGGNGTTAAVGQMTPAALAKTVGVEVANTVRVFEQYYGPFPYKHLAVSNIPYSYGQGWPGLLYLSVLSFLDPTQLHAMGIKDQTGISDFFRAHETSHQWWGHRVGWKSYHDQWMSEGFAQFSGNLYVQYRQNMKEYLERMRIDKRELLERDLRNHVYESVGPIWMGTRLSSTESPRAYSRVIYNKGGWILHMLRMMMWDSNAPTPDHLFIDMMKDFTSTYDNKAASTEDFLAIVSKHNPSAALEPGKGMNWFFRQYVYGTGMAQYQFSYTVEAAPDNKWKIKGTVTQSGVPEGWYDILPLYMVSGGKTIRLGSISVGKPTTPFQATLPMKPDKLAICLNEDVLAEIKQ